MLRDYWWTNTPGKARLKYIVQKEGNKVTIIRANLQFVRSVYAIVGWYVDVGRTELDNTIYVFPIG